jgi:hypothetical protein
MIFADVTCKKDKERKTDGGGGVGDLYGAGAACN